MTEQIEKRRTESIDRLRELAKIRFNNASWREQFLSSPDFNPEQAVELNTERGLRFGVLGMAFDHIHPRAEFNVSNGRLCASMACGWVISEADVSRVW